MARCKGSFFGVHLFITLRQRAETDHLASDFTQQKAKAYGVTGFVKNDSDGTVRLSQKVWAFPAYTYEVRGEAQGKQEDLAKLKKDLNQGPRHAHVVRLEITDVETKDGESSFDA